jgi:hypothetical protein
MFIKIRPYIIERELFFGSTQKRQLDESTAGTQSTSFHASKAAQQHSVSHSYAWNHDGCPRQHHRSIGFSSHKRQPPLGFGDVSLDYSCLPSGSCGCDHADGQNRRHIWAQQDFQFRLHNLHHRLSTLRFFTPHLPAHRVSWSASGGWSHNASYKRSHHS